MPIETFAAFLLTATLLTMIPGLDTAMVLRSATADGPRAGTATAFGIALGCLCWGGTAAFGLTALLKAWPLAFEALRWSGAAYLGWLGALFLLRPRAALATGEEGGRPATIYGAIGRGFTTNILNPKVGAFYLTLLPQFVPAGDASQGHALLLAATHAMIVILWFSMLAVVTGGIRPWLRRPGVVPALDRVTGGILLLLGIQLAVLHQ
jgi:threonine/homoserine/homoserine lactone efflux protein